MYHVLSNTYIFCEDCQQQPVYIGMQFLTKRLLGVDVSLSSLQNVHWVFKSYKNEIINTLKKILELTSKLHDLHNNNVILENRKRHLRTCLAHQRLYISIFHLN